jgi:hypothetical protein
MEYKVRKENNELRLRLPYGYKYKVYKAIKFITIEPYMFEAIKAGFQLFLTKEYTLYQLADVISFRFGVEISVYKWGEILKDPFYTGYIGEHQHIYKPMITPEQFEIVCALLASDQRKVQGKTSSKTKNKFKYAGIFRCDECGLNCYAETKKGRYVYYTCRSQGKHKTKSTNEKLIDEKCKDFLDFYDIQLADLTIRQMNYFFKSVLLKPRLGKKGIQFEVNEKLLQHDIQSILRETYHTHEEEKPLEELTSLEMFLEKPHTLEEICMHEKIDFTEAQAQLLDLQLQDKIVEEEAGRWQRKK